MTLHNKEPRRKNIRLQGYDYARAGLYFLTVVVQNRLHLFGQVVNGVMILNDAGRMVEKWYREIENKYPDKRCREMVVMPNHTHCIIEILDTGTHGTETDAHVGAPQRGRSATQPHAHPDTDFQINPHTNTDNPYGMHNKKHGATIGDVMDWFKTMTTNEYIREVKNDGWKRFDEKLWQRNYYDHIIRDWQEDVRISAYIIDNPAKWDDDKFNHVQ